MSTRPTVLESVITAAVLAVSGAAQAGPPTVYTSLAAFTAATTAQGTDTFAGFSVTGTTPSPITRTAGAYGYTATSSTGTFFGAGTAGNPWLSTDAATDTITFASFTGGVSAIGGNFFGSDIAGSFLAGNIMVSLTDANGVFTQTIINPTTSFFLGFVSDGGLSSLSISAVQPASTVLWPTVDNLVLAKGVTTVPAIPEPQTCALMLAGLAALGVIARRRKAG